jgi:hypothetical protein
MDESKTCNSVCVGAKYKRPSEGASYRVLSKPYASGEIVRAEPNA